MLISLDTVRRDHLSTYGYKRATTPRLDSLASESILFMDAFSQATNTAPSHASMLTGLYPQAHGVVANAELFKSENPGPSLKRIARYQLFTDENGEQIRIPLLLRAPNLEPLLQDRRRCRDNRPDADDPGADHGETLGERRHAMDHGGQVHDEQIRIPLLLRAPNLEPSTVEGAVETIDLMPTILELLQVTPPEDLKIQGKSLVPLISGETKGRDYVFSIAQATKFRHRARGYELDEARRIKSVRTERWKLIRYPGRDFEDYLELYDLHQDPLEKTNVVDSISRGEGQTSGEIEELGAWLGVGCGSRRRARSRCSQKNASARLSWRLEKRLNC